MTTSKSPKKVLIEAHRTAQRALPAYAHRCSPKKFTLHQLFACLVLKSFLKLDYRGVTALLEDSPHLAEAIGLKHVPHFTTLQKASRRLLASGPAQRLLDVTVRRHFGRRKRVKTAAIDSTGLECSCASAYFAKRRRSGKNPEKKAVYHRFPKLGVVSNTRDHFILAFHAGQRALPALDASPLRREICCRRSQVETVMSMLKRRQGNFVRGRSCWSQCRDLTLMVLTHNLMILLWMRGFYRAGATPTRERLHCLLHQLADRSLEQSFPPKLHPQPADFCRVDLVFGTGRFTFDISVAFG